MFITVESHEYAKNAWLMDQMFRLRKKVFHDQLAWEVPVNGEYERDFYDDRRPVYLMWCDDSRQKLYGSLRLMPTTGPTLLHDVFRKTFPANVDLTAPGIWEGTRMCVDEEAIKAEFPDIDAGRAFCLLLLALCECALAHGIHTMISNYEPHLKRIYKRAGAEVDELGRSDGYGKYPVCCGAFDVSNHVLIKMRAALKVDLPLYRKAQPVRSATDKMLIAAA
jgi:N-acyl-L-homoserine lactone synthetase